MRISSFRILLTLILFATMGVANAQESPIRVKWEMGENGAARNKYSSEFTIVNVSDKVLGADWDFFFNNFARRFEVVDANPQFSIEVLVPGYYKLSPNNNFRNLAPGDSVKVTFHTAHTLNSVSYKPDGGHFVWRDGKNIPLNASIEPAPFTHPKQWINPGREFADYPDGDYVYAYNERVNPEGSKFTGSVYEITPVPKQINIKEGFVTVPSEISLIVDETFVLARRYAEEKLPGVDVSVNNGANFSLSIKHALGLACEEYRMDVINNEIVIEASDVNGALNGVKTLIAVLAKEKKPMTLPAATICDRPDLKQRTMMLDISRNFTTFDNLKRYIDFLAQYKINMYQFHFCDDEAWRLEIPGLPELTEVGSRKGYTTTEENFLVQTYAGNGNPDDLSTSANGFYTRDQFIELLRFAKSRGVEIVPEIESPGHARAIIVSMKARERKYRNIDSVKAVEYKVWDEGDTSAFVSAQGYHDNVLNFAQEGTFRFMEKVVDELIAMYREADAPLSIIHIGGDEVPEGSWEHSPLVKQFLKDRGMKDVKEGSEYFIDRVSKMIYDKGYKVGGWQEVALNHSDEFNARVAPRFGKVNAWSTVGRKDVIPYRIANSGYPVVLSNVNGFYLDMAYNRHQDEIGMTWGGTVDLFKTYGIQPYNIYDYCLRDANGNAVERPQDNKDQLLRPENIVGVQGQLWAETIRNFDMVTYYTFPRLIALAERAWNATPSWQGVDKNGEEYRGYIINFNHKVAQYELPALAKTGIKFQIPQPGIVIRNGKLYANTQFPGMKVRYTIDGSEPTAESPLWTAPIDCEASLVKAKAFYMGRESLTTWLFNN